MPEYGQIWRFGSSGPVVMLIRQSGPREWTGLSLAGFSYGYVQILPWAGLPGDGRPANVFWTLLEG